MMPQSMELMESLEPKSSKTVAASNPGYQGPEHPREAWRRELQAEAERLEAKRLLRSLRPHAGRLDFSSNDYLSLNASGALERLLGQTRNDASLPREIGSTASRLIRGHYAIFDRAEASFCEWTGQASALLFTSGYAANVGALPALLGPRDHVFADRLCHASLLDGVRLAGVRRYYFRHNDLDDLRVQLQKHPPRRGGRRWILTESVFSMDGDVPDLPAVAALAREASSEALVYLDEAHSIGALGPRGAGLVAKHDLQDDVAVTCVPCGKAPGLMGAFVCGPPELRTLLVNRARSFVFSTAQPPVLAALLNQTVQYLQTPELDGARARLAENAAYFRREARALGFDTGASSTQIAPVIVGGEARALEMAAAFAERGIDIRAIRPPTVPAGTSRLRVSLQSGHSRADIDEVLAVLRVFA